MRPFLKITPEEQGTLYDLATRERGEIPSDLEDIMMYCEIGEMARFALRQSNAGVINEEDWKRFIREIEAKRGGKHD